MKQRGFILSYIKYGDHDAVLHTFNLENGYQSYFLRGIYKAKNKKKALLMPLNEVEILTNQPIKPGQLGSISQISLHRQNQSMEDVKAVTLLFFMADFLNQILSNETDSKTIYQNIETFIDQVENRNYQSHLAFLMIHLKTLGIHPLLLDKPYLNIEEGSFNTMQSHPLFDIETSDLWKDFLQTENAYSIHLKGRQRKSLLDSILVYYKVHLSEFRIPKSLDVLQQVFE